MQKRAYHAALARGLIAAGRIEEAEAHLDAVGILSATLTWN